MTFYNTIYLSPHFDDAVLSCGGQIIRRSLAGEQNLIVTIMGGDPGDAPISDFARTLHDRWQLDTDIVRARKIEDKQACFTVGATFQHWPIMDCIYRLNQENGSLLYTSEEAIFGEIHPHEMDLIDRLATRLTKLPSHNRVIIPLSIGHHVDHQLTRAAAELAFGSMNLTYYEDYPYSMNEAAFSRLIEPIDDWKSLVTELSEQDLATKIKAIVCYRSQIGTLFGSISEMARQVKEYSQSVGGERFWSPDPGLAI